MECKCSIFLSLLFPHWNEKICWWMSTHTSSFAALGTKFHNGHKVSHPFLGLSDTKDRNINFLFLFFSCKTQHFTKRKTLQRQSFSRINFRTPFKIHIYLPYPITWSKQKCLAYFADLKTSREKLGTFKTAIFMLCIFL